MTFQPTVQDTSNALAKTSLEDPNAFKEVRNFLADHSDLEVLRFSPPTLCLRAIGVAPDLEWHPQNPQNIIPELEGKITQVGYTVFPKAALRDRKSPADFLGLMKKASTTYIHVIENCHLRSKARKFENTEKNSLYFPTRFVSEEDVKTVLKDLLNNHVLEDGSKAPVIVIGHGWNNDEMRLKKEWQLSVPKLDSIVFKVHSLARLAAQAGIIAMADRHLGERFMDLDTMLSNFQIDMTGMWRHNGANDTVYQMTLAFLIIYFPMLYPNISSGFPVDASIASQTINDIWTELAANKGFVAPLDKGFANFCFYCETADDHDADNCPTKSDIICQLCSNALGPKNRDFRRKAKGHWAERCTFHYNHHVRKFPDWLNELNLSLENLRKLSQGMAVKDLALIGFVFYWAVLEGGPMGNYEVAELEASEEARLAVEHASYSEGEPEELEVEDVD